MRASTVSSDRRGVDNDGALFHALQSCFRHVEAGENVSLECLFQLTAAYLPKVVFGMFFGRVVHENIHSPKLSNHSRHNSPANPLTSNIAGDRQTTSPFSLDQFARFLCVTVFI